MEIVAGADAQLKPRTSSMECTSTESARTLVETAWSHLSWDPNGAREIGQRALAAACAEGDSLLQAQAEYNLAYWELSRGSLEQGRMQLARVEPVFRQHRDLRGLWLIGLAELMALRRTATGEFFLAAARSLRDRLGPCNRPEDSFRAVGLVGLGHHKLEQYDDALRCYYETVRIAQVAELEYLEVNALNNAGGLLLDLFDDDDASTLLHRALEKAVRLPAPLLIGLIAMNLVVSLCKQSRFDSAWTLVQDYLIGHETDYACDPSLVDTVIARACYETGHRDEARRYLHSARMHSNDIVGINGNWGGMWSWVAASMLLDDGQPAEALACCEQQRTAFFERGASDAGPYDCMRLFQTASACHKALGNATEALHDAALAHGLFEKLVGRSARARHVTLQVQHELAQTEWERDRAIRDQRQAEEEQERLAELNRMLQAKIEENVRLQQQLVLQEKMASLGTLTAGMAHEINNPVNFAHAGAQVLGIELQRFRDFLLKLAEDADQKITHALNQNIDALMDQVGTIVEGTTRIRDLVKDLRTFSRLDEAERKSVSLGESLRSTVSLIQPQYAHAAQIHCDMSVDPVLDCWPAQLNQVFLNIIVNACQAVQARQAAGDPSIGAVHVRGRIAGQWLEIDFEDNGCGMPPSVIEHIFEPFYTTKQVGDGAGLGLSISFGIVQRHGGDIKVRSTEGAGTRMTVCLPLERNDTLPEAD